MVKNTNYKNSNDIIQLIKSVGGAKSIYKYLTSKGYKINIESIYKWKVNGIPHRYRTIINEMINKNNDEIKNNNTTNEITSSYWNSNILLKLSYLIISIIIILLLFLFYNSNEKKLGTLDKKIYDLEEEIRNTKKNYEKAIEKIAKTFETQSDINISNDEKINKIIKLYTEHEEKFNKVEFNSKIIGNEENNNILNYVINYNDALFYLLWLKDNYTNQNINFNKLPFLIQFLNKEKLPSDIKKSLSIITDLDKMYIKSKQQLLSDIENIISNNTNIKNKVEDNKKNNIFNKIKNLIKISKIDNNINKKLLLQNLNREIDNKKYDSVLNLISSTKIKPSDDLNNWIESINKINELDKSINSIINWMINKG